MSLLSLISPQHQLQLCKLGIAQASSPHPTWLRGCWSIDIEDVEEDMKGQRCKQKCWSKRAEDGEAVEEL